jgi:hypothetical protein
VAPGLRRGSAAALLSATIAAIALTVPVTQARASSGQISIIQDDARIYKDSAGTLARMRLLGAQTVRVSVPWYFIAPHATSPRAPRGFNASDPAAYGGPAWRMWDNIVTEAHQDGITVDFDLMGGAPRWALGAGRPQGSQNPNWEPSASAFGAFVSAIGTRYSGNYDPVLGRLAPGDPNDLPRVSFWSIWNEPDYGPSLAPQGVLGHLTVENSPRLYRNLLDAAWSSLRATGHQPATDTILFGELAPRGESFWGLFSGMTPLDFLRNLYCVDSGYHPLRGAAAAIRGCPTTAAGSRRFRAQNPALFQATGISDHPYMRWYAPNHELTPDPVNHLSTRDYTSLGDIGNLSGAINRLVGVYGVRTRLPIYDTEFGYITSPPKHSPDPNVKSTRVYYLSPATAADYMNWAEYLSWRNPQLRTFDQYLLYDPVRPTRGNDWGQFASGLLSWTGAQKATYYAFRLPLYLPQTTARRGHALEVWGCVRPAPFGLLDTGSPQTAQIQFAPAGSGNYGMVETVTIRPGSNCYFDVHITFPSSGTVRLAYTYPPGDQLLGNGAMVVSRTVAIKVR